MTLNYENISEIVNLLYKNRFISQALNAEFTNKVSNVVPLARQNTVAKDFYDKHKLGNLLKQYETERTQATSQEAQAKEQDTKTLSVNVNKYIKGLRDLKGKGELDSNLYKEWLTVTSQYKKDNNLEVFFKKLDSIWNKTKQGSIETYISKNLINAGASREESNTLTKIGKYKTVFNSLIIKKKVNEKQQAQFNNIIETQKDITKLEISLRDYFKSLGVDVDKYYADMQKETQASSSSLKDKGLDIAGLDKKLTPTQTKTIQTYVNYLEKLTGKKISFD